MSTLKFKPNEKIFAKVRGYPPWPARVEGVADETPNKIKYHVYFYGTGETAVCKQEELFPYLENREKFGKPMKKKGFNEGISQIDSELGLSPSMQPPQTPNEQDSEAEGSLVIDETPSKKAKLSTSTPTTTKIKEVKSKKGNSENEATKKPRKKSIVSSDQDSVVSQKSTPSEPPVSRSGRKIKPKKFSDGNDETNEPDQDTPKGRLSNRPNRSSTGSLLSKSNTSGKRSDMELDAELINDGTIVAFTPKGEEVRLKINLNKPVMFKSDKAKIEWEETALENVKTLKAQIESGSVLPQNVKKEIQEKYKDKLIQLELKMSSDDKKEKLEYLRLEAQLLDIDVRIKSSLSLKQADPDSCAKHLDELLSVQLSPLMVKKHPEIVDTVKKLRKYVGNTSNWNMTPTETVLFASKAALIRTKAEHVYNKIKSLFMVPYGQSFWDVFAKELKTFNETVKDMSTDDVFSLTSDPTDKGTMEGEEHEQHSLDSSAA